MLLHNIFAFIVIIIVAIFFMFGAVLHIRYFNVVLKKIKNNQYEIKEDEIISLNNKIQYSDSNTVISFKFKNYKKIVYEDKRVYHDVQIGDKFYLVFVQGEKEPIKVYDLKNSYIGEE